MASWGVRRKRAFQKKRKVFFPKEGKLTVRYNNKCLLKLPKEGRPHITYSELTVPLRKAKSKKSVIL